MNDGNIKLTAKKRPKVVRRVLVIVGMICMLYVLLEGLAYRLLRKDVISHQAFASVYAPILYLQHHCAWFSNLVDDYENLWYNESYYFFKDVGLAGSSPPSFFTLQDLWYFGMAGIVAGLGWLLIYFPQWTYRLASPEQAARERKKARAIGFAIFTFGIILFLMQCREILIYGF